MKRVWIAVILALLWHHWIFAQDEGYYEIYVNTPSVISNGSANNGRGSVRSYADDKEFQQGNRGNEFGSGDGLYMGESTAQKFLAREKPSHIYFYGYRYGRDLFDSWTYSGTSQIDISGFYPYYNNTVMAAYDGYHDAATTITIKPDVVSLFYFDENGNSPANENDRFLPSDDNITLKATTGFSPSVYSQLRYKAFSYFPLENVEGDVPMGDVLKTFKGADLLSEERFEYLVKQQATVQFQVNYPNANDCKIITLVPVISAPHIVSAGYETPRFTARATPLLP